MNKEGWTEATISDLIATEGVFSDGDWVESKDQDPQGKVRLIQLADIGDGEFLDKSDRHLTLQKARELRCTFLKAGDILIARMPSPLGRACLFPLMEGKYVTVVDVAIVRPANENIDGRFLLHNLNSPSIRRKIEDLQSGTTRKRISRKNLATISLAIAPLPEQRAIVAKIEQLFSELDNGIANLKTTKDKLEIYRQAVLKKAFEGELTKEWRIRNGLGEWRTMPLSDVGDIITGTTPPKKNSEYYVPREYNFYKPSDLNAGHNVVSSIDRLSREGYEVGRKAPENSVLVTCIGATIGKAGFIRKEGCFNQQINAILPFGRYNPKFVYYQVIGADFQEQIQSEASATTLPILNKRKFSGLTIRVCSEQEQVQVVLEIEKRLSVCDKVQISIEEEVEKANLLRQSILKKAFEGSLLTRYELDACRKEPDWEPVDKLLERIKKQRNEQV